MNSVTSTHPAIDVRSVSKTYAGGFQALKNINLTVGQGEIFALLGPNGAGKTTLINLICGIVNPTEGTVLVSGHDIIRDFRAARSLIGLVPQELTTDMFEKVWSNVSYSRELFGKERNPTFIEEILRKLSLLDKRDSRIMTLSGGMKRRVMIAKALAHEPRILFLDEPSAGVDVELRKDMWAQVRSLRKSGVTVILTTHYIEEAEEMADRVGVINKGELIVVEEKNRLMHTLGKKELRLELETAIGSLPDIPLPSGAELRLDDDGTAVTFIYDPRNAKTGVQQTLGLLAEKGITIRDLTTQQSSLEDIFIDLVKRV